MLKLGRIWTYTSPVQQAAGTEMVSYIRNHKSDTYPVGLFV